MSQAAQDDLFSIDLADRVDQSRGTRRRRGFRRINADLSQFIDDDVEPVFQTDQIGVDARRSGRDGNELPARHERVAARNCNIAITDTHHRFIGATPIGPGGKVPRTAVGEKCANRQLRPGAFGHFQDAILALGDLDGFGAVAVAEAVTGPQQQRRGNRRNQGFSNLSHAFDSSVGFGRTRRPSSRNWAGSTAPGACVSRQLAVCVFGNAITSRMLSAPVINITNRSRP